MRKLCLEETASARDPHPHRQPPLGSLTNRGRGPRGSQVCCRTQAVGRALPFHSHGGPGAWLLLLWRRGLILPWGGLSHRSAAEEALAERSRPQSPPHPRRRAENASGDPEGGPQAPASPLRRAREAPAHAQGALPIEPARPRVPGLQPWHCLPLPAPSADPGCPCVVSHPHPHQSSGTAPPGRGGRTAGPRLASAAHPAHQGRSSLLPRDAQSVGRGCP